MYQWCIKHKRIEACDDINNPGQTIYCDNCSSYQQCVARRIVLPDSSCRVRACPHERDFDNVDYTIINIVNHFLANGVTSIVPTLLYS